MNAVCGVCLIGGIVVLFGVLGMCSSCAAMLQSSTGAILGTSYTAEDEDIYDAENGYQRMEENLRYDLEHIETSNLDIVSSTRVIGLIKESLKHINNALKHVNEELST